MRNYHRSYIQSELQNLAGPDGKVEFEYEPTIVIRSVHGVTKHLSIGEFAFEEIKQALLREADRKHDKELIKLREKS